MPVLPVTQTFLSVLTIRTLSLC